MRDHFAASSHHDTADGAQAGTTHRFSDSEMAAIRAAIRDEEELGGRLFALLRSIACRLPFAEDAVAAWYCVRDPQTPVRVKAVLIAALAYFVLPIDAVPDLVPFFGFTDDAAVIAAAIAAVSSALTPAHRAQARTSLRDL